MGTYLITGGTGSLGNALVTHLLKKPEVGKIIVFSRNEHAQVEMARRYDDKRIRFFLGDVRDKNRLHRALRDVDFIIHAAALKHVDKIEYNPDEAISINIDGTSNVRDAAIDCGVKEALLISSDKACNPANLYGATKYAAEKIFTTASAYSGMRGCRFAAVRFGNFIGSNGSVVPLFKRLYQEGADFLPITDFRMTRFFIKLEEAAEFVFTAFANMRGGEVFCPKMKSASILDIAQEVAPGIPLKAVGIRPGEKLHEDMISLHESPNARDCGNYYTIYPNGNYTGEPLPANFQYRSDLGMA